MTASNAHAEELEPLDMTREAVRQDICPEPDHGMRLRLVNIDGSYIVRRFNPSSSCEVRGLVLYVCFGYDCKTPLLI